VVFFGQSVQVQVDDCLEMNFNVSSAM